MNVEQKQTKAPEPKPIRSPSWPNMSLREAVEEVAKIECQYRLTPIDRAVAAKVIGYKTLSGPANKSLAALASYGLLDRAGKGEARVTPRARDILHAENQEQRNLRLLEAALEPDLFNELRDRFSGIPVPPEDGVMSYLNRQGFNPNVVRPATKAFLDTMRYLEELGVSESHGSDDDNGRDSNPPPPPKVVYGGATIGDLVQWESNGVLQLPEPQRVRAISDDGEWVFVEQSKTGLPMSEIIVEEKATKTPPTLPLEADKPPPKGMRKEVITLDEGDVTLLFPENLSQHSYDDLASHMELFLRKAKRRAAIGNAP